MKRISVLLKADERPRQSHRRETPSLMLYGWRNWALVAVTSRVLQSHCLTQPVRAGQMPRIWRHWHGARDRDHIRRAALTANLTAKPLDGGENRRTLSDWIAQ